MSEIDPLVFKLIAETKAARDEVRKTQREMGQSFGRVERDIMRLENQMKRSSGAIAGHLRGLAGSIGAALGVREIAGMVDSFTRLQNSLRVAGLEGARLEDVQGKLLALSTKYGVSVEGLANLYSKASDAGKSFGASQDEILQLTAATSQSLLITGTNAQQASGAILGLSQALASGTVRAEEFNQINEGGLRPLLQAAAATERFGGDINKLRAAVVDGKLSSQEFFNAIMAGSAQLETQASKATLTLSGAFEALSSRLTVYIGSAASAHGVTGALAEGMRLLADNLDVIVPALATIAALMGTTMIFNALASSRAFFALTAAIGGAATAAEAATFAFGGLGAVLTGPVGIAAAVLAVGAGLYYLQTQADGTTDAIKSLEDSNKNASDELQRMIGRLKDAGVETDALAAAATRAKGPIDDLADAYRNAAIEARKLNAASGMATVEQQQGIIQSSQAEQARLRGLIARETREQSGPAGFMAGRTSALGGDRTARLNGLRRQLAAEVDREAIARTTIAATTAANQNGVKLDEDTPQRSTSTKPTKPRTPRASKGPDPLDQDFRNAQELRQLQLEEIRAKEQVATTATAKADLARDGLALEGEMRRADIEEAVRKKQLTEDEAKARLKIIDNLYGAADEIKVQANETAYQAAITREETERLNRLKTDAMRDEVDALQAEAGVTDVRKARVEIERRMLEIQQQIERNLLDEAIARGDVLNAAQARAALGRKQEAERTSFDRDNMGPLGQYAEEVRKVGLNLDDAFEGIAVDGLKSLNDGLTDAIMNSKSLGDVFSAVAKQIIADLIRIAIQQTIVNALMNAAGSFFGGGGSIGSPMSSIGSGSSGFGSALASIASAPPRASGGPVEAGRLYRVNESGMEGFVPLTAGRIIPSGMMSAVASRGGGKQQPIEIRVYADEGATFVPRVEAISADVTVQVQRQVAPQIIETAVSETFRRASRPRMPGAGR